MAKSNLAPESIPLSELSMDRGYRGVDGILIRSVLYWRLLDEPRKRQNSIFEQYCFKHT